jgi:hypothetical protein
VDTALEVGNPKVETAKGNIGGTGFWMGWGTEQNISIGVKQGNLICPMTTFNVRHFYRTNSHPFFYHCPVRNIGIDQWQNSIHWPLRKIGIRA